MILLSRKEIFQAKIFFFIQVNGFLKCGILFTNTISFLDWNKSENWFFPQDIALLILKSFEIGIFRGVNPICLRIDPNQIFNSHDIKFIGEQIVFKYLVHNSKKKLFIIGWGLTKWNKKHPHFLQNARMKIFDTCKCFEMKHKDIRMTVWVSRGNILGNGYCLKGSETVRYF